MRGLLGKFRIICGVSGQATVPIMKSILATTTILFAVLLVGRADDAEAEFRIARIINDRMVLQQEKPIKIWGRAKAGRRFR